MLKSILLMLIGFSLLSPVLRAESPATVPATQPSTAIAAIDREYQARIDAANTEFLRIVHVANARRAESLRSLKNAAVDKKDLDLAIAARDRLKEVEAETSPAQPNDKPAKVSSTVTVTVKAQIDGSDTLTLTQDKATWEHGTYDMPANISVNDVQWDLSNSSTLENSRDTKYLRSKVNFSTLKIISCAGRDIVAAQPIDGGVRVVFSDNPGGSDAYSITMQFEELNPLDQSLKNRSR